MKMSIHVETVFSKIQHPASNKIGVNTSLTRSGMFKDVFNILSKVLTNTTETEKVVGCESW